MPTQIDQAARSGVKSTWASRSGPRINADAMPSCAKGTTKTAVVAAAGALLALAFLPRRSAAASQREPLRESSRAVEPGR
jgi:hypothetical protein